MSLAHVASARFVSARPTTASSCSSSSSTLAFETHCDGSVTLYEANLEIQTIFGDRYCGWTKSCSALKPREILVCWLRGNQPSRVSFVVQDFVHPQHVGASVPGTTNHGCGECGLSRRQGTSLRDRQDEARGSGKWGFRFQTCEMKNIFFTK